MKKTENQANPDQSFIPSEQYSEEQTLQHYRASKARYLDLNAEIRVRMCADQAISRIPADDIEVIWQSLTIEQKMQLISQSQDASIRTLFHQTKQ